MKAIRKSLFSESISREFTRLSTFVVVLMAGMGYATTVFAQSAPDNLQAICESAPDEAGVGMIQAWVDARISDIESSDGAPRELQEVRAAFRTEVTRTQADPVFLTRFAEEAGKKFSEAFAETEDWEPYVTRTMAFILADFNNIGAVDSLNNGLACDREDVRYLCAKGFKTLKPNVGPDRVLAERLIGLLSEAAKKEPNGVIARTLFEAMAFTDNDLWPVTAPALIDALQGRVEIIKQRKGLNEGGNLSAIALLQAKVPAEQDQKVKLVSALAVNLRLDVERFSKEKLSYTEKLNLAREIDSLEALLTAVVRPSDAPSVRGALRKPADERASALPLALYEWIGTEQTPGILNGDPWKVPVGAP